MTIRMRRKKSPDQARNELKLINLENERLKLLKNSLISEKVAKSELSISEFNPFLSLQTLKEFQEKINEKAEEKIDDVNILLNGVRWDSLAYKTRSYWLVALVKNFRSTIDARNFPQFEDLIIKNISASIQSTTVYLEPHITQNDLTIGEIYIDYLEDLNTKIDSQSINIRESNETVVPETNSIDFEKELRNFFEVTFSKENSISIYDIFETSKKLTEKLNSAIKLSHLSFLRMIAYNKNTKSFVKILEDS